MKTLKAPKGATACSWGGREYKVDAEGCVEVPEEAVGALRAHGFRERREAKAKPATHAHGDALAGLDRTALARRLKELGTPVPREASASRLRALLREALAMRRESGGGEA